jgi:hypothetical protein
MEIEGIKQQFQPILVKVEAFRKRQLRLDYLEFVYYISGLALLLGIVMILLSDLAWWCVVAGVSLFALLLIAKNRHIGDTEASYRNVYRNTFLKKMIQELNPSIASQSKDISFLQKSGLLGLVNNRTIIEAFQGETLDKTSFQGFILDSMVNMDSYGGAAPLELSSKLYLILDTKKDMGAHTIIFPKGDWVETSIKADVGNIAPINLISYSTHPIDPVFNTEYSVYSKDRKASKALLNLELLHKIDELFKNSEELLKVALVNHKIYLEVALEVDYFLGDLDISVLEDAFIKELYYEIKTILHLIEAANTLLEIDEKNK